MRRRNSEGKRTRTSHLQNTIPNQQSTRLQQMRRKLPRRRRTLGYSITQKIPLIMLGGYADMSQRIKQLQTFLTDAEPQPITEKHQFQKPQPKIGRPSESNFFFSLQWRSISLHFSMFFNLYLFWLSLCFCLLSSSFCVIFIPSFLVV